MTEESKNPYIQNPYMEKLCERRKHRFISLEKDPETQKEMVNVHCNTCNLPFKTSVHSYKNARKTGCPNCKKRITSENWKGKVRTLSPEKVKQRDAIKASQEQKRLEKAQEYEHLKNREDLVTLLEENPNPYNKFILERMASPETGEGLESHHIIPRHAGGPDVEWNLIDLTPEDHFTAHQVRAEVFGEPGDINAVKLRGPDSADLSLRRIESIKRGDETRKTQKSGIYASGVSSKGGKASGAVKSIKKEKGHATKMTNAVQEFLYNGGSLTYCETNLTFVIEPGEFLTLPPLVEKLKEITPVGRNKTLLNDGQLTTITSSLARVIKEERASAYGWSLT